MARLENLHWRRKSELSYLLTGPEHTTTQPCVCFLPLECIQRQRSPALLSAAAVAKPGPAGNLCCRASRGEDGQAPRDVRSDASQVVQDWCEVLMERSVEAMSGFPILATGRASYRWTLRDRPSYCSYLGLSPLTTARIVEEPAARLPATCSVAFRFHVRILCLGSSWVLARQRAAACNPPPCFTGWFGED
ncbi:hypothetical protein, variant [Exophiala dermatitidis NIH/UT8656]|uniref:Uncharacterized protein n=1 Tax=Exophiala dermatitidis (strain ATCC 34100 / CBS 525.76 / NIH/UT8656) TaxID=858893 RepID=H6BWM0_EXODN|nr:uncharacterized protein HMPREF1120_04181 [Exophiala dermatitidis NIH/UT8656]XP_009156542.1 hypothetical protein, variant [Exophiala dermatitidis NIH/UT8656]EHY56080.1 hypothetical protein, variant [Exophiala dermatitidis NIH/UT8656]EHY56081.1 hypothetical protein HMPREF1120_04181 [Exophiala dermatitidis NIH/UT8656]